MSNAGEIIKHVRTRSGLTQKQLAKRAGLSSSHVVKYLEDGTRSPSMDVFIRIIQVCDFEIVVKPKYREGTHYENKER